LSLRRPRVKQHRQWDRGVWDLSLKGEQVLKKPLKRSTTMHTVIEMLHESSSIPASRQQLWSDDGKRVKPIRIHLSSEPKIKKLCDSNTAPSKEISLRDVISSIGIEAYGERYDQVRERGTYQGLYFTLNKDGGTVQNMEFRYQTIVKTEDVLLGDIAHPEGRKFELRLIDTEDLEEKKRIREEEVVVPATAVPTSNGKPFPLPFGTENTNEIVCYGPGKKSPRYIRVKMPSTSETTISEIRESIMGEWKNQLYEDEIDRLKDDEEDRQMAKNKEDHLKRNSVDSACNTTSKIGMTTRNNKKRAKTKA